MSKSYILLASASCLALAACGGSNGNNQVTITPAEEALRIFSTGNGDLGDVISDGQVVTARQIAMAGINLNFDSGITELTPMTEFRVQQNESGEFTLWLNGSEWAFTPADRDVEEGGEVYGYFTEAACDESGTCVNLYSWSGEIDELKTNGNGYHGVLYAQSNQVNEGQPDLAAFGVIGTETMDADLAALGTATYSGRMRMNAYPSTGFVNSGTSRTRLRSNDLTMTADFGAGTISGSMDELLIRDPGEEDYTSIAGVLTLEESSFQVNGFTGAMTADAAFTTATGATLDASSSYTGVFFGPNAEEVAGTISASGSDGEGGTFNAVGFYSAYEDTE